ncbi:hypothetical protein ACOQFL_16970 [Actinopolyspora sp. H202]|uniref:hypothetical protein n=1 Tax=Actinopolyspora sp. H202 TaxID=1500456 RepID=UPI003EE4A157
MSTVSPKHGHESTSASDYMSSGRIVATALLPWFTAKFLFKPRVGPLGRDRVLDRLAFWRSVLGLGLIMFVTHRYQAPYHVWFESITKSLQTALFALTALPLPFLVMLGITKPGYRAPLARGALLQLGRTALALGLLSWPFVWVAGVSKLTNSRFINLPDRMGFLLPVVILLLFTAALSAVFFFAWFLIFDYCTVYWGVRTGFWINDTHPLLAPFGTTSLMLLVTGRELFTGSSEEVPLWLWVTLNLAGAVSTIVLSYFECRHLRSIGYRFRTGPVPIPHDENPTNELEIRKTRGPRRNPTPHE